MGILKLKGHVKDKDEYLFNAVHYIIDGKALPGMYGSPNTTIASAEAAFAQMNSVKSYFRKGQFNPLYHIVVSFDINEVSDSVTALIYTHQICSFFSKEYQLVWAIHNANRYDKKQNMRSIYHSHIVINPVSFINGYMLQMNNTAKYAFLNHIKNVTHTQDKFWYIENYKENKSNRISSFGKNII